MTTLTPFVPSPVAAFQFSPTLDGQSCTCIVTWNLFGQRWYLNLYDQTGTLVFCRPLTGSPDSFAIMAMSWENGTVTVETELPHGFTVGSIIDLTFTGSTPDAYNGVVQAFVADASTLQYPLATDPGTAITLGVGTYNENLVAGYFDASTLVYRTSTQNFEVTP